MSKAKTPDTDEFRNFIELLGIYTDATNRLNELQVEADKQLLQVIDEDKDEYAKLQETITATNAALEVCARKHPEWFGERKSISTPYGTVKLTDSSPLTVPNEELSIVLIQQQSAQDPEFKSGNYLRVKTELNLEALGTLDDATLLKFRITRTKKSNFKVEPAKVKLGKGAAKKQPETANA